MALALVLRCGAKPSGLQQIARLSAVPLRCSAISTIATRQIKPLTLTEKVNQMFARKISLTQPRMMSASGNHAFIWTLEKLFSVTLFGLIPAAFMFSSPLMDNLLAVNLVLHQHWGIDAVVLDYIRPSLCGPVIPVVAMYMVYAMSILTLGSLLYFNYKDVGITKAVKQFWALKSQK